MANSWPAALAGYSRLTQLKHDQDLLLYLILKPIHKG